jgi:hypothetical protein
VPTKKVSKHWRQIDISERVEFFRTENTSLKIRISKLDLQSEDDKVRYGKDLLELKKAKETGDALQRHLEENVRVEKCAAGFGTVRPGFNAIKLFP